MRWRGWAVLVTASAAMAPIGWVVSDRLEENNGFCIGCHLPGGERLHRVKFDEFVSGQPVSLAAAHFASASSGEGNFRCIDCHRGTSLIGRARVKAVAARDSVSWVLGRFDEPDRMLHPLWTEDCAKCHETYAAERDDAFHALAVHNIDMVNTCVECHDAHPVRERGSTYFLSRARVLPLCRNCHEEF